MLSGIFSNDIKKWNHEISRKSEIEVKDDVQKHNSEISGINSSIMPDFEDDVFSKHKDKEDLREFF